MDAKRISSADNPKFKAALKLLSNRGRHQQGLIVIFGLRETLRAIDAGAHITEVFVCQELMSPADLSLAQFRLSNIQAPQWNLSETLFARLAYGDRVDGLLAVARRPSSDLAAIELPVRPLIVVLESIEKPGNIGAVARSADAIAASALILANPLGDLYHPNCIRASLGCIFGLKTAVADSVRVKQWLRQNNVSIVAAKPDANVLYTSVDFAIPTAIILGNEARGLSPVWSDEIVIPVSIPMRGLADSLNVSVTAAVLMFEAARQRAM